MALAIGGAFITLVQRRHAEEHRRMVGEIAVSQARLLERQLDRSLSSTFALASILHQSGKIKNFDALAAEIIKSYGGIDSLQLAPNGVVTQIYPLAGNEAAIGHDLLNDPRRRTEALKAIASRQLTVAGPFPLIQGGQGVIGRLPVFVPDEDRGERFWGFTIGVVRLPTLFEVSAMNRLGEQGYDYELSRIHPESGARVVFARSAEVDLSNAISFEIQVPNGRWALAIAPRTGWPTSSSLPAEIVLVVLVSSLLAAITYALMRQPEVLRQKVALRTREIAETNRDLETQIVQREQAEETIRQNEERLRVLVESTNAIPWEADAKTWQFTYVGPQAFKLVGYRVEQWYEKDFWVATIHPEDREHAVEFCQESSRRYQDYEFEYRMIAADGRVLWIHDIVNVVSVDGVPETLRGFMIDITPWKQAKQALHESEEQISLITDSLPVLITYVDADRRYQFNNAAYETWFGISRQAIKGRLIKEVIGEAAYESIRDYVDAALSGRHVTFEAELPYKHGGPRHIRAIFVPHIVTNGNVLGFYALISDVTEQKMAEEAVDKHRKFLRQVIDINPNFIFAKDREGRFTLVNQAVADAYGTTVEDLIGKTDADFNPKVDEVEFFRRMDLEVMDTLREKFIPEEAITDAQGNVRWMQTVKRPIMEGDSIANQVLGSATDITDRKQVEKALLEQTEHIRLLQRITVAANEAVFVDKAIQVCLDEVCALTRWPVGHAYVLAGDGSGELVSKKLWHLDRPQQFETFRRVTEGTRFKPGIGLPGRVLDSGKAAWIVNVDRDPNFPQARVAENIEVKTGFACPVLVGKDVVAVLEFFSTEPVEPDQRLLDVMDHVGTQLGRVIERKRLEKAILEASEREQRRIGQDLHDGLSQHLTGVAFLSKGLAHKLDAKSKREAGEAAKIAHLINQAIVQTRDLARGLYPVSLEATGLVAALQELADQVASIFKISCRFQRDDSILVRDNTKATHLYYIAREAVNNAIKHAKAQAVVIGLDRVKDRVILTVKDDGIGLPEEVERTKGMGLHTMNHRARMVGASLGVHRDPAGGTVVACSFKTDEAEGKGRGRHGG
ncbi:MAG: PAS domain S-box protein [Candidatus Bipolaricaulia bacterium]